MLYSDCDKARHQEFLDSRKTNDCATQNDGTPQIVVNELLSHVAFYRNRASSEKLRKLLVSFYTPTEINIAKKLRLVSCCPTALYVLSGAKQLLELCVR